VNLPAISEMLPAPQPISKDTSSSDNRGDGTPPPANRPTEPAKSLGNSSSEEKDTSSPAAAPDEKKQPVTQDNASTQPKAAPGAAPVQPAVTPDPNSAPPTPGGKSKDGNDGKAPTTETSSKEPGKGSPIPPAVVPKGVELANPDSNRTDADTTNPVINPNPDSKRASGLAPPSGDQQTKNPNVSEITVEVERSVAVASDADATSEILRASKETGDPIAMGPEAGGVLFDKDNVYIKVYDKAGNAVPLEGRPAEIDKAASAGVEQKVKDGEARGTFTITVDGKEYTVAWLDANRNPQAETTQFLRESLPPRTDSVRSQEPRPETNTNPQSEPVKPAEKPAGSSPITTPSSKPADSGEKKPAGSIPVGSAATPQLPSTKTEEKPEGGASWKPTQASHSPTLSSEGTARYLPPQETVKEKSSTSSSTVIPSVTKSAGKGSGSLAETPLSKSAASSEETTPTSQSLKQTQSQSPNSKPTADSGAYQTSD
jgi:hypothetical protein